MKNKMVHIGALELGITPRIVVVVDRVQPVETIAEYVEQGADLFELRVDLMGSDYEEVFAFCQEIRNKVSVPLLGTLRETPANVNRRIALFNRMISLVDAIDIEVDTPIRDEVVALAVGKTIVVSEHDYVGMPSLQRLSEIADAAHMAGAHIVKIAATAHTRTDVTQLLTFCQELPYPMVAIAMGELGALSRVCAPLFGSLFSYAFVNEAVAPGQMSLGELMENFDRFYS